MFRSFPKDGYHVTRKTANCFIIRFMMRFKIAVQINIPTTRSSVNIDSVTDDGYVLMTTSRMMSIWPLAAGGLYLSVLNLFVVHKIWSIWQIEEIEGQILTMLLLFFGNGEKSSLISVHLLKC